MLPVTDSARAFWIAEAGRGEIRAEALPSPTAGDVIVRAFPDASIRVVSTVEAGDTIVTEGVYGGTHTGPLDSPQGTVPPTGRAIDLPFVDIFRVRDGKAVVHHLYFDQLTFMAQLGLMPQPAG